MFVCRRKQTLTGENGVKEKKRSLQVNGETIMLQKGDLLKDRYKILKEIGRGGMSIVYLAEDEAAGELFAVKTPKERSGADPKIAKERLENEAKILKRLNHPALPKIADIPDTGEEMMVVIEYIKGCSLQELMIKEGAQPEKTVIMWAIQLCAVLRYLHDQEPPVIYLDMKLSNIMRRPDGRLTLIDFGTAKELKKPGRNEGGYKNEADRNDNNEEKNEDENLETVCLGTRGYAAPEQYAGAGQTDERTDIYTLGVVLYHLLTGHSPSEPPYEIKPAGFWIPRLSGTEIEKVIEKCTMQDPQKRYQNCEELMRALERCKDKGQKERSVSMRKPGRTALKYLIAAMLIAATAIAALVGAYAVHMNAELEQLYFGRVEAAAAQENISDALKFFLKALEADPGRAEAYEALMNRIEEDILANDGRLTSEASDALKRCLTASSNGYSSNQEALKNADPEAYARLMYKAGIWQFFMRENTPANKKNAADNYFSKLQDDSISRFLSEDEREISAVLLRIGGYMSSLGSGMSRYGISGDKNVGYYELFDDLKAIADADLKSIEGNDIYVIEICRQIAYWLDTDKERFEDGGVTPGEIRDLMNEIKTVLLDLDIGEDSDLYEEYEAALETTDAALRGAGDRSA